MTEVNEIEFKGTIKKATRKEGPNGMWINVAYTLNDGKIYSTFEEELQGFQEGQNVIGTYITKGKYNNIESIKLDSGPQQPPEEKVEDNVWEIKDKKIIRQHCNTDAIELLKTGIDLGLLKPSDMNSLLQAQYNIAKQLELHVYEGL